MVSCVILPMDVEAVMIISSLKRRFILDHGQKEGASRKFGRSWQEDTLERLASSSSLNGFV
jgi:hypothetical protein